MLVSEACEERVGRGETIFFGAMGFALLRGLLAVFLAACAHASTATERASFFKPASDPLALEDVFLTLDERARAEHWSSDADGKLVDKLKTLTTLSIPTTVEVRLVDLYGEGNRDLMLLPEDFSKYLNRAYRVPLNVHHVKDGQNRTLPISHDVRFHVSQADDKLSARLRAAIHGALSGHGSEDEVALVDYRTVEDILEEDFESSSLSYTLYVLNPPMRKGVGHYMYADLQAATGGNDKCGYATRAGQGNFVWLDLTAGPSVYGPHTSGDGLVLEYNVPRTDTFYNVHTGEVRHNALVPELVAFAQKAVDHLFLPTPDRFPVPYERRLVYHLFTIHDDVHDEDSKAHGETRFDWAAVQAQLAELELPGQTVSFESTTQSFWQCEPCVAAYTHSLKSHTSNVMRNGLQTLVHPYVDSAELHAWLQHYAAEFKTTATADRVVPIFLFDLESTKLLLLDRFDSAHAYDDMVIAVQTKSRRALTDMACNSEPVRINPADVTRNVLAATLQTTFGVSPTHERWEPVRGEVVSTYTFSGAATPFGVFSPTAELSFSQHDAARRNALYSVLVENLAEVQDMLQDFAGFRKEVEEVLTHAEHVEFVQRWNIFRYKIDQAARAVSLHDFPRGFYFAWAAQHDSEALQSIVHSAGSNVRSTLTYVNAPHRTMSGTTEFVGNAIGIIAGIWVGLSLRWLHRRFTRLRRVKRAHGKLV